jgi:hypothetical protein
MSITSIGARVRDAGNQIAEGFAAVDRADSQVHDAINDAVAAIPDPLARVRAQFRSGAAEAARNGASWVSDHRRELLFGGAAAAGFATSVALGRGGRGAMLFSKRQTPRK